MIAFKWTTTKKHFKMIADKNLLVDADGVQPSVHNVHPSVFWCQYKQSHQSLWRKMKTLKNLFNTYIYRKKYIRSVIHALKVYNTIHR